MLLTGKRWRAIALSPIFILGLVGCGASISPGDSPSATAPPTTAQPSPQHTTIPPQVERSPILDNPVPPDPLPGVNDNGDYQKTSYRSWVVDDPDPAGLNCRWSDELPAEWYSPATPYPRMNVNEWPIVRQFPTGTELQANITPAGFALMYDENQAPWLKVNIGEHDEICLVRANTAYIEPIPYP